MEHGSTLSLNKKLSADRSVIVLLLSNLLTLVLAVWQHWNVAELLWIYWG